jgi:hypothetical protein
MVSLMGASVAVAVPSVTYAEARFKTKKSIFASGRNSDGRYIAVRIEPSSGQLAVAELPGRGHGFAIHPKKMESVIFARRPGTFMSVLSHNDFKTTHEISSRSDRHFYGHGVFSNNGNFLFASENDFKRGQGVIGIYETKEGYRRIGEFSSKGVGPHEIQLMPGGRVLAVANGGIRTHPNEGRAKLNLTTMKPNFSLIDIASGKLIDRYEPSDGLHRLSVRHLDVNHRGEVVLAMQFKGEIVERVPLVAFRTPNGNVRYLRAPKEIERSMRHYVGSIRFDGTGNYIGATCPRGNLTVFWSTATGQFLGQIPTQDASSLGAVKKQGSFIIAGGDGIVRTVNAQNSQSAEIILNDLSICWDNHLVYG